MDQYTWPEARAAWRRLRAMSLYLRLLKAESRILEIRIKLDEMEKEGKR
jgi:hypothetical protein